jgi:hypothetical protein
MAAVTTMVAVVEEDLRSMDFPGVCKSGLQLLQTILQTIGSFLDFLLGDT